MCCDVTAEPREGSESEEGRAIVDEFVSLLDLEPIDDDIFRGRRATMRRQRVFGGQVAAQALVAAGRTVDSQRVVHSLHSYFIRPGDPSIPIVFIVDRVRDGRSFSTRRVVAVQHGQAIFSLSASFQVPQTGLDHQLSAPDGPSPQRVEVDWHGSRLVAGETATGQYWPFDVRYVDGPSSDTAGDSDQSDHLYRVWMKARAPLPDDGLFHACALTYACDLTLLDAILVKHGLSYLDESVRTASLDHAVWFHRPFRADEWLLYAQTSPTASGGRGLTMAQVFDESGQHVASVVQEGVVRVQDLD